MTLAPSEGEEQVYRKESIPADVKDGSVTVVKSEPGSDRPVI